MCVNHRTMPSCIIWQSFQYSITSRYFVVFPLESPHRGDSNEYIQYAIFNIKKKNNPKLSQICSYGILFQRTQEGVRNSRGRRAISVQAM